MAATLGRIDSLALTVALKPPITTYNKTTEEITHILNSRVIAPLEIILTRKPVAPNKVASKGTLIKKVTRTVIILIVSLL